jgi:hypothetical protein
LTVYYNHVHRSWNKDSGCAWGGPNGCVKLLATLTFISDVDCFAGTGIALVAARHARVPVLLHDTSSEQINRGLSLVDKLLAKDVDRGRLSSEESKDIRGRIQVASPEKGLDGLRDVDMVVEVGIAEYINTTMVLILC